MGSRAREGLGVLTVLSAGVQEMGQKRKKERKGPAPVVRAKRRRSDAKGSRLNGGTRGNQRSQLGPLEISSEAWRVVQANGRGGSHEEV